MDELMGKVATGLITAIATLLVCLINNYFQSKRVKEERDEKTKEHLNSLQTTYVQEINGIKDDYSDKITELNTSIGEVKSSITQMVTNNSHQLDMIKLEIKTLSDKQSTYNNLQARTFNNEKEIEVLKAKVDTKNG